MKLSYRKDIDGLRAIAVLAVILNHARIPGFSGGYVGVDVFFVISGYLITSIIVREIRAGEFTLVKFYERRIRRILPAWTVVAVFTFTASMILYDAEKFRAFGKSLIAATLFSSNINFWMEAGYFDAPSQLKPLLHTWSLAVEEQFYIVFPLLVLFIQRSFRKQLPAALAVILLISFGFAVRQVAADPATAFYMAHLRSWELLIGSLLALQVFPNLESVPLNNALAIMGMLLIGYSIHQFDDNTLFPGLNALPTVAGTALLLYGNSMEKNMVGRFLSFEPLVFIGKISYSLYLWHWSIIIFANYYAIRPLTAIELGGALFLIFIVSALSWRWIETPFRSKSFFSTGQIYGIAAGSAAFLLVAAGTVYVFDGFPSRAGAQIAGAYSTENERWLFEDCDANIVDALDVLLTCRIGSKGQPETFMVWGDSQAPTYGKAIHEIALQRNLAGVITYLKGCPPLMDIEPDPKSGDISCPEYNQRVIEYLKNNPQISTVIMAGRFTIWVENTRYKYEEGGKGYLRDATGELPGLSQDELFRAGLEKSVTTLQGMGRTVILIAPVPEVGYDVPSANYIALKTGRDVNLIVAPTLDEFLARNSKTLTVIEEVRRDHSIRVIEPWKTLCNNDICRVAIDETPLYVDNNHLSVFGTEFIAPIFDGLFDPMER